MTNVRLMNFVWEKALKLNVKLTYEAFSYLLGTMVFLIPSLVSLLEHEQEFGSNIRKFFPRGARY